MNFIEQYAYKLRPVADSTITDDPVELSKYIEALFKFAVKVKNQMTFRGTVIYNYMIDLERRGEYNRKVLKAYLKIPKCASIYQSTTGVGMQFDYQIPNMKGVIDPIGNDEPYIRRALTKFFIDGDKATPWTKEANIDATYCLPLWSETMLLLGKGNEKFQIAQRESLDQANGK